MICRMILALGMLILASSAVTFIVPTDKAQAAPPYTYVQSEVPAQNATNIGGLLSANTIWSKANSPYTLSSPLTVSSGTTLTIQPGVVVNLSGFTLQVNGAVRAQGTVSSNIVFNSGGSNGNIAFSAHSDSWNEQTSSGCLVENAVLNSVPVTINSASPKLYNNTILASGQDGSAIFIDSGSPLIANNIITGDIEDVNGASPIIANNTISGGVYGMGLLTSSPIITNNVIKGGSITRYGIGIRCDGTYTYVADNTVSGCRTGIEGYDGNALIQRNLVFNNSEAIVIDGLMSPVSDTILNNTIVDNGVGIRNNLDIGTIALNYNNFENNTRINLRALNASYNWWGTTNEQALTQIFSNSTSTIFKPYLNESNPEALPVSPQTAIPTPNPGASPTYLSIAVDTSSIVVGSTVYVNGKLTDANGSALQNESVVLSYDVIGNGSWIPIGSSTTDQEGNYVIQWASSASGTFAIKADWRGDENYLTTSNITSLSILTYQSQNVFFVESNSTVTALAFNSTSQELSFIASGPSNTTGYVKVTIAKTLLSNAANIKIYLDGNHLDYNVTSNDNTWLLTFSYHHSTHEITIEFGQNKPTATPQNANFTSIAAIVIIAACIVGVAIWRTRSQRKPQKS